MGWRNVTHGINELPVCLPKRRCVKTPWVIAILTRLQMHCPLPPPLSTRRPGWAQSGLEKESSKEKHKPRPPATAPFPQTPTTWAINKLKVCPLGSAGALPSSSRHQCLITHHSTAVKVKVDLKYCRQRWWREARAVWDPDSDVWVVAHKEPSSNSDGTI